MFTYNRFWHFWHMLDNRYYARVAFITPVLALIAVGIIIPAAWSFPIVLTATLIAPTLIVTGVMSLLDKLSNFFYKKQNEALSTLKKESTSELYKEQVDYYLNRRAVCPQAILKGEELEITDLISEETTKPPLMLQDTVQLYPTERGVTSVWNRNKAYLENGAQLFMKEVSVRDGLYEVAAGEMASLIGLDGVIPANAVSKSSVESLRSSSSSRSSDNLVFSRSKISKVIGQREGVKNTPGVQNAVAKFVSNLKRATFRTQMNKNLLDKLTYVQSLIPNAKDGLTWFQELFSTAEQDQAKELLQSVDQTSYEQTFLLQLVLGSEDANPGNTLFETNRSRDGSLKTKLHSIDHERIMPENNYNITKRIPIINGAQTEERNIKNVFPIRLWLAGLPQADVAFSRDTINKIIKSLDPTRLASYHRQKKLFSGAAVGAQLDRVRLIRSVFLQEASKDTITLTPKALFLKLVNNHPSYGFLKGLQLSDFSTFLLLGQVPEDADWSIIRHPTKTYQMWGRCIEMIINTAQELPPFSPETFATSAAPNMTFFTMATAQREFEKQNPAGLDALQKVSDGFSVSS